MKKIKKKSRVARPAHAIVGFSLDRDLESAIEIENRREQALDRAEAQLRKAREESLQLGLKLTNAERNLRWARRLLRFREGEYVCSPSLEAFERYMRWDNLVRKVETKAGRLTIDIRWARENEKRLQRGVELAERRLLRAAVKVGWLQRATREVDPVEIGWIDQFDRVVSYRPARRGSREWAPSRCWKAYRRAQYGGVAK